MLGAWAPLLWSVALLAALWFMSRRLAYYFMSSVFLLTKNETIAASLYAIFILPGTIVHEIAHWLMANIVGVKTGKIRILPELQKGGTLRLGSVDVRGGTLLQHTLIGMAPLIVGSLLTLWLSSNLVDVEMLSRAWNTQQFGAMFGVLRASLGRQDALIALYLLFTVSDAMFLSASDRAPIQRMLLYLAIFLVPLYFLGLIPTLPDSWSQFLQTAFEVYTYGLFVALAVHIALVLMALTFYLMIRVLLGRHYETMS